MAGRNRGHAVTGACEDPGPLDHGRGHRLWTTCTQVFGLDRIAGPGLRGPAWRRMRSRPKSAPGKGAQAGGAVGQGTIGLAAMLDPVAALLACSGS